MDISILLNTNFMLFKVSVPVFSCTTFSKFSISCWCVCSSQILVFGYVMFVKHYLVLIFISLVPVQYLHKPLSYKPTRVVTFGFKWWEIFASSISKTDFLKKVFLYECLISNLPLFWEYSLLWKWLSVRSSRRLTILAFLSMYPMSSSKCNFKVT